MQRLRGDVDLGLRMVEGLMRMGEHGAAARLVEELHGEVYAALEIPVLKAVRPEPRPSVRRSAVLAGTVAAALGIGLSAAALVTSPSPEPIRQAPPSQVRVEAPAAEAPAASTPTRAGLRDAEGAATVSSPGAVSADAPAASDPAEPQNPASGPPVEPGAPAVEPPDELPPVLGGALKPPPAPHGVGGP